MTEDVIPRCRYSGKGIGTSASCCYRELWGDRDHCIWHADIDDEIDKPIEELQSVRETDDNRQLNQGEKSTRPAELLDGARLSGKAVGGTLSFSHCSLRQADLSGANLVDADLSGANLVDADLSGANLVDADLSGANLTSAEFSEVDLEGANLSKTGLRNADLSGTDLEGAALSEAILRDSNLSDADLEGADLSGAELWRADLSEAFLRDADLSEADLWSADLSGAYLRDANLTAADLRNTDLSRADLRDANLTAADMRDAAISDVRLNHGTQVNRMSSRPTTATEWDNLAQAYHNLKTEFRNEGLDERARDVYFLERRARTREAWANRDIINVSGAVLSRYLTGYGIRVSYVLAWTLGLLIASTVWYSWIGATGDWRGGSVYYSIITLVDSPPHPPPTTGGITGAVTQAIVLLETYIGTTLIVLLGYVLSNRD